MSNEHKSQSFWHNFFSLFYIVLVAVTLMFLDNHAKLPQKISPFDFFLVSSATFRLIRLFVYDSVTSHIRGYLDKFESGARKELSMLINCPWCTGVWMGFLVGFLYFLAPLFWYPIFLLALAGIGSYLQIIIKKIGQGL
jgi:hypothetical protein